jgi:hypothetical protein
MAWFPPARRVQADDASKPPADPSALITQITEPTLPGAKRFVEFWHLRQPAGVMVGRDVPSRAIAPLLSSLIVYEPVDDGRDWRIRLAGAALLRRFGRDVTGSLISELYPQDHFLILRRRALLVMHLNLPQLDDVVIRSGERTLLHFETVHVPVYAPDGITRWDMAGYFYFD